MKKGLGYLLAFVIVVNLFSGLTFSSVFATDVNDHANHLDCRMFEDVDTKKYDNGLYGYDQIFFDSEVNGTLNIVEAGFTMYQYGNAYPNLQVIDSYIDADRYGKSMVLRLTKDGYNGDQTTALKLQYSGFPGLDSHQKFIYKMDLNVDNWYEDTAGARWQFFTDSQANDTDTPLFEIIRGAVVYHDGNSTPVSTGLTVTEDAWDNYFLVIDREAGTHSLYHGVTGKPLYENAAIPGGKTDPLVIIGTRRLGENSSECLWVDNFCVYDYDEASIPTPQNPLVTPTPKPTPTPTPTPTLDPGATPKPDGTKYIPTIGSNWIDTFEGVTLEDLRSTYSNDAGGNLREITYDPDYPLDHVYHIKKDVAGGSKTMRWYEQEHNAIFTGYATTQFQARIDGSTDYTWDTWDFSLRLDPYEEVGLVRLHTSANGTVILEVNNGGAWEELELYTVTAKTWHTYSVAMSQELGKWRLYVDGELVTGDLAFESANVQTKKFHAFYFISNHPNNLGNEIWLDNVCGYFGLPNVEVTEPTPTPDTPITPDPTPFPQTTMRPAGENDLTVAFIGGSITEGTGANMLTQGYAYQVGNWFERQFADKNVNIVNAGYGGTWSGFGMFRLKQQVIDQNPDIVFVEFAVNDTDYSSDASKKYMEGIVRSLQNCEKIPKIVFVYTTKFQNNGFVSQKAAHQEIANTYGIPSIDVGAEVESRVAGGTPLNQLLGDGVHPTQAGHDLYAKTITDLLESDYARYIKDSVVRQEPYVAGNTVYQPRTVSVAAYAKRSGDWSEMQYQDQSGAPATKMTVLQNGKAGDSFEMPFYGKYIGISYVMTGAAGSVSYYIDGKKEESFPMALGINYQKGTGHIWKDNLTEGWHTLRVVVDNLLVGDVNAKVMIGDILIDDGLAVAQQQPAFEYAVGNLVFAGGQKPVNGDFTVHVDVSKLTAEPHAAYLVVAAYDDGEQMLDYALVPIPSDLEQPIPANLSVATNQTIRTVKAFVWEIDELVSPLSGHLAA